jgi:hypothetical protein
MRFAGHKTFDTYWIYYMAKESIDGFLCSVLQVDHPLGAKTPMVENPERQRQTPYSEENSTANPETRKCAATPGKLMPLESDEPREIPIANPADVSPLSAGKTHNNRHDGFILTARRSGGKP